MRHKKPFQFIRRRIEDIKELLYRARWYLNSAVANDGRKMWEYAVMHELRSDAKVINEGVDVLNAKYLLSDEQKAKVLSRVKRYGKSLLDMSDDFLTLLRDRSGHVENEGFQHPCDFVREFLGLYSEEFEWRNLSVIVGNHLPSVYTYTLRGAKEEFRRVVYNLLHNAHKFAPQGSDVDISQTIDDKYWILTINNQGVLSKEELHTLFQPFFKPRTSIRDGVHIGLAASHSLVRQVGGKLEIRNAQLNGLDYVCATLAWPLIKEGM